jgi:hypothetical protein
MNAEQIKQDFREYLKESENIVLPGSYKNVNLIQFDEFEIAEENGRSQRKGEIKTFERENFEEEYDLELPKKKSDFPFMTEYKSTKSRTLINPIKVKIVDETDTGYFLTYTGIKTGFIFYLEGNENIGFLVNKKKIQEFKKINDDNSDDLYDLYQIAQGK